MNILDTPAQHIQKLCQTLKWDMPSKVLTEQALQTALSTVETVNKKVKSAPASKNEFPVFYGLKVQEEEMFLNTISSAMRTTPYSLEQWTKMQQRGHVQRQKGWHLTILYRKNEVNKDVLQLYDRKYTERSSDLPSNPTEVRFGSLVDIKPCALIWDNRVVTMIVDGIVPSIPLGT
jgi:Fungal tRNA ligase phosphodiesterase domain